VSDDPLDFSEMMKRLIAGSSIAFPFTFADPFCKWCRGDGMILAVDPRYFVVCSCRKVNRANTSVV
jgi:hypothetical protein